MKAYELKVRGSLGVQKKTKKKRCNVNGRKQSEALPHMQNKKKPNLFNEIKICQKRFIVESCSLLLFLVADFESNDIFYSRGENDFSVYELPCRVDGGDDKKWD